MPYPRTFQQHRQNDGYELVMGRLFNEDGSLADVVGSFIISRRSGFGDLYGLGDNNVYEPMRDEEGLFLRFAKLGNAPEADIAKFADEYGYLGPDRMQKIEVAQEGRGVVYAESVESWRYEARKMDLAVRLWKYGTGQGAGLKLKQIDGDILEHSIRQQTDLTEMLFNTSLAGEGEAVDGLVIEDHKNTTSLFLDDERLVDESTESLTKYIGVDKARFFLSELAHIHLAGQVHPTLNYISGQKPRVELVPTSLYSSLWLQLALGVHGGKEVRVCPRCNESFLMEKRSHDDRKFCNKRACNQKAYRERQKRATQITQKKPNGPPTQEGTSGDASKL